MNEKTARLVRQAMKHDYPAVWSLAGVRLDPQGVGRQLDRTYRTRRERTELNGELRRIVSDAIGHQIVAELKEAQR